MFAYVNIFVGKRRATLSLKQIHFAKGFCKSKQERTSEKEELCIGFFDQKVLKRTVLAEKGPIILRKTFINREESYQTGFRKERRI